MRAFRYSGPTIFVVPQVSVRAYTKVRGRADLRNVLGHQYFSLDTSLTITGNALLLLDALSMSHAARKRHGCFVNSIRDCEHDLDDRILVVRNVPRSSTEVSLGDLASQRCYRTRLGTE